MNSVDGMKYENAESDHHRYQFPVTKIRTRDHTHSNPFLL